MNIKNLKEILDKKKQPAFRFKQIMEEVYKKSVVDFDMMTNLPKDLREVLSKEFKILSFQVEKNVLAKDKKSVKALLKLKDGNHIETVLISGKPENWSVCLSSQVGCPLACTFCATGKAGYKRNLSAEEITDQILFWQSYLNEKKTGEFSKINGKISNIVYMGMGEPFLNWDNVKQSLSVLTDKSLFGFGDRSISVSTVGIPDGIKKLGNDFPQVNLAISLHSANDKKRDSITPINKRHDLRELKKAVENYLEKTKRKVFIEYVMIDRVNDSEKDASELVNYLRTYNNSYLLLVNLIAYNDNQMKFKQSPTEKIVKFKNYLMRNGINTTIRKSSGKDISGACGQLAGTR